MNCIFFLWHFPHIVSMNISKMLMELALLSLLCYFFRPCPCLAKTISVHLFLTRKVHRYV